MLSQLHVIKICDSGSPTPCRYLSHEFDQTTYSLIYLCTKRSPPDYKKLKKNDYGVDRDKDYPDNCNGYLPLRHVEQGRDIDGLC